MFYLAVSDKEPRTTIRCPF